MYKLGMCFANYVNLSYQIISYILVGLLAFIEDLQKTDLTFHSFWLSLYNFRKSNGSK